MMLVDLGCYLAIEECLDLKQNLLQYCSILAAEKSNEEDSTEKLVGMAEFNWTSKLAEIIHNLQKSSKTADVSVRLKYLLGEFNHQHDYKVSCNVGVYRIL